MKKKLFSAILAAAMCLSLAACGGNGSTPPANSNPGTGSANPGTPSAGGDTDWPKSTVTVILPYGAGGDTDTYCRQLFQRISELTGGTFVVTNKIGRAHV